MSRLGRGIEPTSSRGIREAFAWQVWRAHLVAAPLVLVLFLFAADLLRDRQRDLGEVERARVCAAALDPGPDGDYTASVDRLQRRYPWLLGVGVLDTAGRLVSLFPDDAALRSAAEDGARGAGAQFRSGAYLDGQRVSVTGVKLPLNGSHTASATRGVFLFYESEPRHWQALLLTGVGVLTGLAFALAGVSLVRWFRQEISAPLKELSGAARVEEEPSSGRARSHAVMRWRELADVARGIAELRLALEAERGRTEVAERRAESRLKEREAGFDRQLRRALDQAMIDPLTGLRNRRYLDHELEHLVTASKSKGEGLAAIMLDLDHFKRHNDTFGHKAGDEVLRFVGELIRSAIRPSDHGIRYGGDEFLILLPGADEVQAEAVADRIVRLFAQYAVVLPRAEKALSISAGVASTQERQFESGLELIAHTDTALYQAKAAGRNTVVTSAA